MRGHLPSHTGRGPRFRERRVFPGTDLPWGLPEYEGDRDAQFECPNAVAAVEGKFRISIHENWGEAETSDMGAALRKVHDAFAARAEEEGAPAAATARL